MSTAVKIMKTFALCVAALVLSGCAQFASISVSTFQELPDPAPATTISVFPGSADQQASLEYKTYSKMFESHLGKSGYTVVPYASNPNLVALFGYGISGGKDHIESYAIPNFGVTGYSGSTTSGNISKNGNFSTSTSTSPIYGVTGYNSGIQSFTTYDVSLKISIVSAHDFPIKKLYESTAMGKSLCQNMAGVMPYLFDAIFKGFPRPSGSSSIERTQVIAKVC